MSDDYGLGLEAGANSLSPANPLWARAFAEEAARLAQALGTAALGVEHVGSTAVPGLAAKPILDLMVGVNHINDGLAFAGPLAPLGYDYSAWQGIADHHIYGKGQPRTHLLHVVEHQGDQWRAYLCFRDRLRADDGIRRAYEILKLDLAVSAASRGDYTIGKTAFVLVHSSVDGKRL